MSEPDLEAASRTAAEHAAAVAAAAGTRARLRPSRASALRPDTPEGVCANCGAALMGPVCHVCGQHADLYKRPVWSLIGASISDMFALDGRVARTLTALMAFPGRVTRDYLKGRRGRYIPPFRLYLIASLAFFLILPLVNQGGAMVGYDPNGSQIARERLDQALAAGQMTEDEHRSALQAIDALAAFDTGSQTVTPSGPTSADEIRAPDTEGGTSAPPDQATDAGTPQDPELDAETVVTFRMGEDESPAGIEALRRTLVPEEFGETTVTVTGSLAARTFIANRIERLATRPDRWAAESLAWAPRIMFVMVPLFAALLGLVYAWRRGFLYFDHLITALQFHAAIFIAMLVAMTLSLVTGPGFAVLAFFIYAHVYLYRLLRVVYSSGRVQAVLRVAALDLAYGFLILLGLTAVVLLGAVSV
ncbi:MAG: DUF3667 domain-containing protein [Alphaproteobacteria bacterium]|nr:DUF3667 domain-containing protein [Alphaproteobacteria bacterium]